MKDKKIITIVSIVTVIILILILFIYLNTNKIIRTNKLTNQLESKDVLVIVKHIDKEKENGYLIYKNGNKYKYNLNKSEISLLNKKISEKKLNRIKQLIKQIDDTKVTTINTLVAIEEGTIIYVYNDNMKILIQDFYSNNYSEAATEIKSILKQEGIL